jgi:hypothetical protein
MPMTRRSVLTTAATASVVSGQARAGDMLFVTGYPGEYHDIFMETGIDPFEKEFSCQVIYDVTGGADPYQASLGRPDVTGWPDGFVNAQITTKTKMEFMVFADDGLIAQKQREWTLKWQDIMCF